MAADLFEDQFELNVPLLEASAPSAATYPYAELRLLGSVERRAFRSLVLENPYLRVEFAPDLGGRLMRWFDKRLGKDVLPLPNILPLEPGGSRGVYCPHGIDVQLSELDRPHALGTVSWSIEAPEDAEDPAVLMLGESSAGGGMSWQMRVSLEPAEARLQVEVRVMNRSLQSVPYWAGLTATDGLAIVSDDLGPNCRRFDAPGRIGGRQVDTWSGMIVPCLGSEAASSEFGSGSVQEGAIRLLMAVPVSDAVVEIETPQGVLKAPVDLYPDRMESLDLGDLRPNSWRLRSASRDVILSSRAVETSGRLAPPAYDLEDGDLEAATFDVGRRHLAFTALGMRHLRDRQFAAANRAFESALNVNAEDHLVWWAKAVALRLSGVDAPDRPELPNAHFLAPLEPVLRAEAFLSQAETGVDPSPLVAPLNATPDDFVEVACVIIEHGLLDEAHRWIDEALRHRSFAMLRYLQAYVLLKGTRLDMDAAYHVSLARTAEMPPYPWRQVEMLAVATLAERFPDDARLAELNRACQESASR